MSSSFAPDNQPNDPQQTPQNAPQNPAQNVAPVADPNAQQAQPPYASQTVYGSQPGAQPGFGAQPGVGSQAGGAAYGSQPQSYTNQTGYGSQPGYTNQPGQPVYAGGGTRPGQSSEAASFFTSLFSVKFDHYITVKFASVIYAIAIVLAILQWISCILLGFTLGGYFDDLSNSYYSSSSSLSVILGILAILFGWVPALIQLIGCRLFLEFFVATIRTAESTTAMKNALSQ